MKIAAVLLAAGRSTRFAGGGKLLAPYRGKPLVRWAADAARGSKARPIIAVTGHRQSDVETAIGAADIVFVHNPDYAEGLAASLRAGVSVLPADIDGALICLGDMPRVTSPLLDSLIDAFAGAPAGTCGALPTHDGRPGNPALLGRELLESVAMLSGDTGAGPLLKAPGAPVLRVPVGTAGILYDVDAISDMKE